MNELKRANAEREGDRFIMKLQGPAVRVEVGAKTAHTEPIIYVLPGFLLAFESGFFNSELGKLHNDKVRATLRDHSANPTTNNEILGNDPIRENQPAEFVIPVIRLPGFDHSIFGMFVGFLYHGQYEPCYAKSSFPITKDNMATHAHIQWPETPEQCAKYLELREFVVPPSMLAHQLGTELSSPRFTHFSMFRIWKDVGQSFSITPAIVSWVLNCTPRDGPLRRFVVDVLIQHWNNVQSPHVAKPVGVLKDGWEQLFQDEKELSQDFIFGMGVRRIQELKDYLTLPIATPTAPPIDKAMTGDKTASAENAENANSRSKRATEPPAPLNVAAPPVQSQPKCKSRAASEAALKVDAGSPAKKQKLHAPSPAAATAEAAPAFGTTLSRKNGGR